MTSLPLRAATLALLLTACIEPAADGAHRITVTFDALDGHDGAAAFVVLRTTSVDEPALQTNETAVASGVVTTTFSDVPSIAADHIVYLHVDVDGNAACDDSDRVWGILVTDRAGDDVSVTFDATATNACEHCCASIAP